MKHNTYKVLAQAYSLVNENFGYFEPVDVTWTYPDGKKVTISFDKGTPVGYEFLGYANSGIDIPDADDWLEWSTGMHTSHSLSPSKKVYYSVDSSG